MNIELHVIEDGVDRGVIPSCETVTLSPVFCDYGSFTFTYPKSGKKYSTLLAGKDEIEIVPYVNGVRQEQLGGMAQEISGDDVAEASVFSFSGVGYLMLLDEAVVYPKNWPNLDVQAPSWVFVDATAGTYLKTLVQEAQARGALVGVTTASFTTTTDSNGQPWTKQISLEVKPGTTLTNVVKALHEQGLCEFEMVGRDLRLYNAETLSVDRTVVTPPAKPLTFRRGRDLKDSPRKVSSRDVATVLLAAGKEDVGLYHEEVDAPAVAARRRIEGFISNGNITDAGTLNALSEFELAQRVNPKMEKAHGLEFARKKSPQPLRDFNVGDWAFSDVGKGLEKLRVKQWVLSLAADGSLSGSVVLNDLFAELEEKLAKKVDGIIGGTTITGESKAEDRVPGDLVDGLAPATPQGLSLSSVAYGDDQGHTFAQVSASWLQVTTNSDGTILEDLEGYRVQWRYQDEVPGTRVLDFNNQTFGSWSPVTPDEVVYVRVQAYDRAGNSSAWSAEESIPTASDSTPPGVPAAPLVDNYLGLLRVRYTGATASGAAVAPDQNIVEVHVSTVNNFTTTAATLIDKIPANVSSGQPLGGVSYYKGAYTQQLFAKLVAVDHSGNRSAASAQGSATPQPVVGADILDGAVGTLKLADLAVTSAKIGLLAVNDAQIGSVSVGKLIAGTILVDVLVGGRLATAFTGQRAEMNALGFQARNASDVLTVDINGVSNLLTGIFKTAPDGRRIEIGAGGAVGEINFYAPTGRRSFVRAWTESSGTEAVQFGIEVPNSSVLWNRINFNSSSRGEYATYRCGTHEFVFDGGPDQLGFDGVTPNAGRFVVFEVAAKTATAFTQFRYLIRANETKSWADTHTWTAGSFNSNRSYLELVNGDIPSASARLRFMTSLVGGGFYGGMIKYVMNPDTTNYRFEFLDWSNSYAIPLWASQFVVSSDGGLKEDIRDLPAGSLEKVRSLRPRWYKMKTGDDGLISSDQVGVIAQEAELVAPEIVTDTGGENGKGIDLYALSVLNASAIGELAAAIDDLKQKIEK